MFVLTILVSVAIAFAAAQQHQCLYTGGPNGEYSLNLTAISDWTMEIETPSFFAYYTPCGNRMQCHQGSANYYANVAQFKQGINACAWYLSVDHHDRPTYSLALAAWHFHFEDGELCEQRNAPRVTDIYYNCVESHNQAHFFSFQEYNLCEYLLTLHSPLACVPENRFNTNCQWRSPNGTGGYYTLDLSTLKGEIVHTRSQNGYEHYYSPCQNGLSCHQQYHGQVMNTVENHVTGTCEHYTSVWEEGRVQPLHITGTEPTDDHWSFHYFNGQTCSDGSVGEEHIRYFCDPNVEKLKVMNDSYDGNCRWEMNLASKLACTPMADILITADKAFW